MQDERLLRMIYRQMQVWLALVGLTYVALFSFAHKTRALYDANSFVFGSPVWLMVSGVVAGFAIMLFASARPTRERLKEIQLPILIVFSIFILALTVLLTGGFIDSPFSGAISLYLGFFIALIHAGKYLGLSCIFVSLTVICLTAP